MESHFQTSHFWIQSYPQIEEQTIPQIAVTLALMLLIHLIEG